MFVFHIGLRNVFNDRRVPDCVLVRKRVHISKTDFSFLEAREREGILCPGVLHVSHRISRGVCGSLGIDTRVVIWITIAAATADVHCGYT